MSYLVFVSHVEEDDKILKLFNDGVKNTGIELYIAEDNYESSDLNEKLKKKIRESQILLSIYTPRSKSSTLVRDEMLFALGRHDKTVNPVDKTVNTVDVPILLFVEDGTDTGGFLQGMEEIRFHYGNFEKKVKDCVEEIIRKKDAYESATKKREEDVRIPDKTEEGE